MEGVSGKNPYISELFADSRNRGNRFLGDLEDHLSEMRSRKNKLYTRVPGVLDTKVQSTSASLGASDPKALQTFSGYFSAFSYDKRARFVNNISEQVELMRSLSQSA